MFACYTGPLTATALPFHEVKCVEWETYLSEALKTQAIKRPGTPGNSPSNSKTSRGTIYKKV